jgi:hypothetical protein
MICPSSQWDSTQAKTAQSRRALDKNGMVNPTISAAIGDMQFST